MTTRTQISLSGNDWQRQSLPRLLISRDAKFVAASNRRSFDMTPIRLGRCRWIYWCTSTNLGWRRIAAGILLGLLASSWGCQGKIARPQNVTVQGCLTRADAGYKLTDDFGHSYKLNGDESALSQQVRHVLLVKGNQVESSREPEAPPSANHGIQSRIDVASFKSVSNGCNSGH